MGEEGAVRVRGEAGAELEAGRRCEHRRCAAFFVKPATTTSPTRREPTLRIVYQQLFSSLGLTYSNYYDASFDEVKFVQS
jgi:hypothetical protein